MTEKFKKSIDKGNGVFGALQNNLSNPFDCIDCTLLITKLFAFGVSLRTLMYRIELNKSKQKKNKKRNSERANIEFGTPQPPF